MCCSVKWSQTSAHPLQYVIYSKFFFFFFIIIIFLSMIVNLDQPSGGYLIKTSERSGARRRSAVCASNMKWRKKSLNKGAVN